MSNQILDDSFEAIVEIGQQTAKQVKQSAVSTVKKTVNELTADRIFSEKAEGGKIGNHTPLDAERMKKLEEMHDVQDKQKEDFYKTQDEQKIAEVQGKLSSFFKEYKQKEERAYEESKQEKETRIRREEEEKVAKEREKQQGIQAPMAAPKGKVRRNIFQRAVKSSQAETRVGTGGK
jgi:hypothetical protein